MPLCPLARNLDNKIAKSQPIAYLPGEEFMSLLAMIKMTALPEKRTELLQTLEALKTDTCKADFGCLEYRFYQEGEDDNNIILIMGWQSREKLAAYQNSDQHKILLGAISLLCQSSDMKIGTVPNRNPSRIPLNKGK
jgi:quinol monooxygenase YgiN